MSIYSRTSNLLLKIIDLHLFNLYGLYSKRAENYYTVNSISLFIFARVFTRPPIVQLFIFFFAFTVFFFVFVHNFQQFNINVHELINCL